MERAFVETVSFYIDYLYQMNNLKSSTRLVNIAVHLFLTELTFPLYSSVKVLKISILFLCLDVSDIDSKV